MSGTVLAILGVFGWIALMVTLWALMRDSARREAAQREAIKKWREGK